MSEEKTVGELLEEVVVSCYGCGKNITEKKEKEIFVDGFFLNLFGVVFCSEECRDDYINSK